MDLNSQKEKFADAWLSAVAAVAGCSVAKPSPDDDSIDWTLSSKLPNRPKLDIQLKCTALQVPSEPEFSFDVKLKNYEELRLRGITVSRILVVVLVPDTAAEWMQAQTEETLLRRAAFWASLASLPDTPNTASVTLRIPSRQTFTVQSLCDLLQRVNDRTPL